MFEETTQDFEGKAPGTSMWQRRWVRLALIWGIWTFIGLVFTLQTYFTSFRSARPTYFVDSLFLQMTWSYLWALATPLVLFAASRLPIERNNWARSSLLHIPISVVLSGITTALGYVLMWLYFDWSKTSPFSLERLARFVA